MAPSGESNHRHQVSVTEPEPEEFTPGTRTQASSPDYVTLDFNSATGSERNYRLSPLSPPKPKRGLKKQMNQQHEFNKNYNHQHRIQGYHLNTNGNPKNQGIYQNFPMYTNRVAESHLDDEEDHYDERDRQFATAICIFSSVLTMVLVLMFYLVGEVAFRSILLILSFVFFITLFLACFLRRPSAVIFANNQQPQTYPALSSSSSASRDHHHHHSHSSLSHHQHHQHNNQKSPLFLIVPNGTQNSAISGNFPEVTSNYRIVPANSITAVADASNNQNPHQFCPIHHPIVAAVPEMVAHTNEVSTNAVKCIAPSEALPALPPKPKTPVPTPPPIGTIPGKNNSFRNYAISSSASTSSYVSSDSESSLRDHLPSHKKNNKDYYKLTFPADS